MPAKENRQTRSADAASLENSTVRLVKPRLENGAPAPAKPESPPMPEKIFEYFDSSPASSPIKVVTKEVVPWVDYMIFEKMKRIFSLPRE